MGFKSIAIDGPAGAGKSTLARQVAAALGYLYVDTGAIYRTLGLAALRRGVDPQDGAAVVALLEDCTIDLRHGGDGVQRMYLNGEDVSQAIRLPEVSRYASGVSAIPDGYAAGSGPAQRRGDGRTGHRYSGPAGG